MKIFMIKHCLLVIAHWLMLMILQWSITSNQQYIKQPAINQFEYLPKQARKFEIPEVEKKSLSKA